MKCRIKDIFNFYKLYPEYRGFVLVKTKFGFKQIEMCDITAYNSEVIEIKTKTNTIKTSPEHKLYSKNWIHVNNLSVGDILEVENGSESIISIKTLPAKQNLYDLQVADVHEFYANKFRSHNSNLLDTIIFGLYGKVTKDVNKDQIPNWKNKKNCEVKVTFTKGKDKFLIHRGINPTILKVYKNEEEEGQISHNRDFQTELEKYVLGIDYDTFISIAHYNATQSQSIFSVSKGAKRAFLEKLFGLELYTDILIKCNNKSAVISNKISTLQQEISFNERNIIDLNKQMSNFNNEIEETNVDNIECKVKELQKERKLCEKEANTSIQRIEELKEKKILIQKKLDTSQNAIIEIEKKIYSLQDTIANIKSTNVNFDMETYQTLLMQKKQLEDENYDEQIEAHKNWIIEAKITRDEIHEKISALEKKIHVIGGLLQSIPTYSKNDTSDICPLCGSNVSIEHINVHVAGKKEKYNMEVKKLNDELVIEVKKLKNVKTGITEYEEIIEKCISNKHKLQVLNEKVSKMNVEKEIAKQNRDKEKEKENLLEKLKKLKDKLNEEQAQKNKFSRMITIIEAQTDELHKANERIKELDSSITQCQVLIESKNEQINKLKYFVRENKDKIAGFQRSCSDLRKQESKLKSISDYLDFIKKVTKDEGVRTYAIQNTIPFLTKQVNKYLADAGVSFYLKLDSQLNVEVRGPGIVNASFGSLSSGQQKVTNLAMLLAFLDLFKLRSPICTNTLLLDEVLDSAIDSVTLTQMMSIVAQKQATEKLKVFIVSHRKEIAEIPSFDNIYKSEMNDGFSKISKVEA